MGMIQRAMSAIDIGGAAFLVYLGEYKLFGNPYAVDYLYEILKNAKTEEYPRYLKNLYQIVMGESLNLSEPVTYNEKIQWLKIYDATPIKTKLADKHLVRDWVTDRIGSGYLVPVISVYDGFDDIDFDKLPDRFALKCNHGSGWNAIVTDKTTFDKDGWRLKFKKWCSTNYAFKSLELQYRDIRPCIVCEKLLEEDITDYRVFCFGGHPEFIKVTRHNKQSKGGYDSGLYYPNWNKCEFSMIQGYGELQMDRPSVLEELLEIAKELSKGFAFVRVDCYIVDEKIYFSEMTFTPNSGYERLSDRAAAVRLGNMINLKGLEKNG